MKFTEEMINEDEKRWHARNVVTELRYCGNYMCDRKDMNNTDIRFYAYIMRKAHAMLKEQEAVEPRRDANCVRMFRCGACGEYVGFIDSDPGDPNEQDNYCRNCGRKVKWE